MNLFLLAVIAGFFVVAFLVFFIATKSFKLLKTDIEQYYSFDLSLKGSGGWSILFFFAMIAILGLAFLFFSQANFALSPA